MPNTMPKSRPKKVILAFPHGFCAGVVRALAIAEHALARYGRPIYCFNELVHNEIVVADLQNKGVIFVKHIAEIPCGALVIFSAHGVPPAVRQAAAERQLVVLDATCPFVEKIHRKVQRFAAQGYTIFLIGHPDHEEIIGLAGEAPAAIRILSSAAEAATVAPAFASRLATVVTQTTLSVTEAQKIIAILQQRFPYLTTQPKKDICYATENRQQAVQLLGGVAELILVLGSKQSSNTRRLKEIALGCAGARAAVVSGAADLQQISLAGINTVGLTAGASTPEYFVEETLAFLARAGFTKREHLIAATENITLRLPPGLEAKTGRP